MLEVKTDKEMVDLFNTEKLNNSDIEEKKFSQREVNKIIANKKREFKKEWEHFFKEMDIESVEELKERLTNLTDNIKQYEIRKLKCDILVDFGLSLEFIDFIQGCTVEEIKQNVLKLSGVLNKHIRINNSANQGKKQRMNEEYKYYLIIKEIEKGE